MGEQHVTVKTARRTFERLLEGIVIVLTSGLFLLVVVAVVFRKSGNSIIWYDEIAEVMLAWLTYGAALAALRRGHIGVTTVVNMFPKVWRLASFVVAEATVAAFFVLLAWVGWRVLDVLTIDFLATLPELSSAYTHSVIPIGAVLYLIAQGLSLPEGWRAARRGRETAAEEF
ncbi:MAG: TRAP transporter small permease subunit [Alphaproteobacteria bacterium]|nr:TRAP transporter small permease subunit [Alphaproteobacteria bacterium]